MPITCKFELKKEREPHISGQDEVVGEMVLTLTSVKYVREITLELRGVSKCAYAPDHSPGNNYTSHKVHCSQIISVQSQAVLAAGVYGYPFSFTLPRGCPSSVEGEWGHIRYGLYAVIKYAKNKYNDVFQKSFSVLQLCNMMRDINTPIETGFDTEVDYGLTKGKFGFTINIRHGSYVPGEILKYSVYINNIRGPKVEYFEVTFVRKMKFQFYIPEKFTKYTETVLYRRNLADENDIECVEGQEFTIPSTPPTIRTKNVCVHYILRLKALSLYTAADYKAELPVFIGTNLASGRTLPKMILPGSQPAGLILRSFETAQTPEPTFNDLISDERYHEKSFQPLYLVYRKT